MLDGAGRHVGEEPGVPADLTLIPPPPHGPALDLIERIREHPRDRRLGRRVLAGGHRPVVDAARAARDALPAGPAAPAGQPPLAARVRHHVVGRCKATPAAACW